MDLGRYAAPTVDPTQPATVQFVALTDVLVCRDCGAYVHPGAVTTHDAFHTALIARRIP